MKKIVVLLSVLLVGAAAIAVYFAMELEHERERAGALAVRAYEHEPIEKGGQPSWNRDNADSSPSGTVATPPVIEPANQEVVRPDDPPPRKAVMDYPGTLRSRQQVERLQVRLANGTPLQDYQIRALIVALDDLHAKQPQQSEARDVDQSLANERMIQVASDILFESQLEKFMEMLKEGDGG